MIYDVMSCGFGCLFGAHFRGLGVASLPVPHRSVQRFGHLPPRLAPAYGHSTVPDLVLCFRCTGPLSDPCAGVVSPDR